MNNKTVAIIGGGFSGLAVVYNLLQLNSQISIDIFDDENFKKNGKAYQTTDISHILNVPVDKMGLPHNDEGHFYRWISNFLQIDQDSFVPRGFYRFYLQEIIAELQKQPAVNFINNQIVDIKFSENKYLLTSKEGTSSQYDNVVIACGLNSKKLTKDFQSDKVVNDIWQFFDQVQSGLKKLPKLGTMVIAGTGLTMIDAALSFKNSGFQGKIIACSGNAKLPLPHSSSRTKPVKTLEIADAKLPLSQILKRLKTAAKNVEDWQSVIHGIRGITSEIWQEFSLDKKRQFLRHLSGFWNIHRHRVSKNNNDQIIEMIEEGVLEIVKGRVKKIEEKNQQIIVTLNNQKTISADLVLNAMGFDFSGADNVLINSLLREKIIVRHPTNLGFEVIENHPNLYLTGSLLTGKFFEITAVPDLRNLAYKIANQIANPKLPN